MFVLVAVVTAAGVVVVLIVRLLIVHLFIMMYIVNPCGKARFSYHPQLVFMGWAPDVRIPFGLASPLGSRDAAPWLSGQGQLFIVCVGKQGVHTHLDLHACHISINCNRVHLVTLFFHVYI